MEIICRISSKNIVIIQNMSINSVVDGRERCLRPYFPLSLSFFLLLKIIQLKKTNSIKAIQTYPDSINFLQIP
jgi:hypothetical protein